MFPPTQSSSSPLNGQPWKSIEQVQTRHDLAETVPGEYAHNPSESFGVPDAPRDASNFRHQR